MDFALSEEQELLRQSARQFLENTAPIDKTGRIIDSEEGWDDTSSAASA